MCVVSAGVSSSTGLADAAANAVPGGVQLVGEGGGLTVGVVGDARRAAAFVTDGKARGLWFSGGVRTGTATLSDQAGGTVTVRFATGSAAARVQLAGRAAVDVRLSSAASSAGWFVRGRLFVEDGRLVQETTGWVRLASGAIRGTRRLESSDGSISFAPASASLSGAERVTPESALRCLRTGGAASACGLPLDMAAKPDVSRLRVLFNPPGSRLTEQQLKAAFLRNKSRLTNRARAAGLFQMTATDRRIADGWAAKLRANKTVMDASQALRSALLNGSPGTVASRQTALEDAIAQNGLTMPTALRDRVAALRRPTLPRGAAPSKPVGRGTTTIFLPADGFAVTEETSTQGDYASFPNDAGAPIFVLLPAPDPASKRLFARASAGFNSDAEKSIQATAAFTVPPNVQQVEIEVERTWRVDNYETAAFCLPPFWIPSGFGQGWGSVMINAERINADGSTVVADGFHQDAVDLSVLPQCGFPVPDPPALTPTGPVTLRFTPPAQGGNYQLDIHLRAHARTMGIASADGLAFVELQRATVRFRRT